MAHIAIDARKYFDFGIGTYVQNLSNALSRLNSLHRYSLLISEDDFSRVNCPVHWTKQAVNYRKYSLGELFLFGYQIRRFGIDLLHAPHYTLPLGLVGKSVVTVHDLIHLKFPQYFNALQKAYARTVFWHVARSAGAIITGSEHTKRDVVETLKVNERKVYSIYHGVQPGFQKIQDPGRIHLFRERFGLRNPYVLYVGNIKPHKNIPTLLKAFAQIAASYKDLDLVFAGELLSKNAYLTKLVQTLGIGRRIRDLGQLPTEELIRCYSEAEVLVLPSLYEGFGFTAVEAMACETPVVAANAASLPEVVGDAGVIFETLDPKSLEDALRTVLSEPQTRRRLVEEGKRNIRRFSWDQAAQETLRVYETVLNQQ